MDKKKKFDINFANNATAVRLENLLNKNDEDFTKADLKELEIIKEYYGVSIEIAKLEQRINRALSENQKEDR